MPTDHLPECPWPNRRRVKGSCRCICPALRACETRARAEEHVEADYWQEVAERERDTTLTEVREAVAEAYRRIGVTWMMEKHVLAAIDALIDAPHVDPCDCDKCVGKA